MSLLNKSAGLAQLARKSIASNVMVKRTMVTPPRVRISFTEKMVHAALITVGVTTVPVWILFHLEDYRTGNNN